MDPHSDPARIEPDALARVLDEQLWQLQRLGIGEEAYRRLPTLGAVADQLEQAVKAENRIGALLRSTLDDAGRDVPEYEAARAWYGLTTETAGLSDLDRHIAAFHLLNELREDQISYDAFRTRVALEINQAVSYRIMLRYRHATEIKEEVQSAATNRTRDPEGAPSLSTWTGPRLKHQTLPAAQWFVGRDALLSDLSMHHAQARKAAEPPVTVITGTGGMGKTSLALRWAHLHSDWFPDGQIYVDLRGFHPSMAPLPATEALRVVLDAFGIDRKIRPGSFDGQLALYREITADRRVLLVADNARDAAQVEPLLPSGSQCMAIVTSRNQLAGLTAWRPQQLEVDRLSDAEAADLLRGFLGDERVAREPDAVDAIVERCGGMALALAIVAGRARKRADLPLSSFANQLADAARRLDLLDSADPATSIRAVMSWSYPLLSIDAATTFRVVAAAPGSSLSIGAICAALAWNERQTDRALRGLEDASLLRQTSPGRFSMHDLVRLYAIERGQEIDSRSFREAASRRLSSYYLHSAYASDRLLAEFRRAIELTPLESGVVAERPTDESQALGWFAAEYQNLVAAQRTAVHLGWAAQVLAFAWTLDDYRWRSGLIRDDINAWQLGLEAATEISLFALGLAHRRLGRAYGRAGEWHLALDHVHKAIEIANEADDDPGAAHGLRILSWVQEQMGDETGAMEAARESFERYFLIGNPVWSAHALSVLGDCHSRAGDEAAARDCWERALALHREHGHDTGEAETLLAIGTSAKDHDEPQAALPFLERAVEIYSRLKDTYNQAGASELLGVTFGALEMLPEARTRWEQALALYRDHGRDSDAARVIALLREGQSGDANDAQADK